VGELLYRVGGTLAGIVPPAAAYCIADALAAVSYHVNTPLRRAVRSNLRHVLPPDVSDAALGRAGRAVFQSFAHAIVDFLRLPSLTGADLASRTSVEGAEQIEAAREAHRGIVIASAHLGSWEVGAAYLAASGLTVRAVVRPHRLHGVERFYAERRRAKGVIGVQAGAPVSALLAALRRGECVALLADRHAEDSARAVHFFGAPASLPRGHVTLALRARAPLLIAAALRTRAGFRIVWERVPLEDLPATADGVRAGVVRAARVLERLIASHPTQWHVFEPIWPSASW